MSSEVFHSMRNTGHSSIPEVVLRTRRTVMEAAYELQAQRTRKRRQIGIALLVLAGLLVLATPALWTAVTDLTSGETFFEMPVMLLTLTLVLLSAMFAVLLVSWRGRHIRDGQR